MRQAVEALYEALILIETPRGMTIGAEEERALYFSQFAPAFDMLIDLLVDQGRFVEAIEVSERRRSRTFLDQLRASGVDVYETLPESDRGLVAAEKGIADAYFATLHRIQENPDDATLADDLAKLRTLRDARYEAHKQVISASRAYRQVLADPQQSHWSSTASDQDSADWVRARIGADSFALIYYLGSANSYVFAGDPSSGVSVHHLTVSPSQAQILNLAVSRRPELSPGDRPLLLSDVAAMVNRVLFGIKPEIVRTDRGGSMSVKVSAKFRPQDVPEVTDVLLPALLQERIGQSSARHLLVVPDGALHQLPFEALPLHGEDNYLIDVLPPVVYAPSLAIYDQLVSEHRGDRGTVSLLSVADPRYRGPRGDRREPPPSYAAEYDELGGSLSRLAGSKRESDAVRSAFEMAFPGRAEIVTLTDQDATEANVRTQLDKNNYAYLHFAVHGLVDQRHQNLFGALAFSTPDRPTPDDDGFLSLHEIMTLPSPLTSCELAVLSACQTNCGPQSPLEAGSTMARAFLCAGAQRVVSSHWSVSDEATTELISQLMGRVATELARDGRADYAQALHDAKMELRKNPATNEPQFWAPFVLIGPPTGGDDAGAELF
jgi:CHAT domain-containing protein